MKVAFKPTLKSKTFCFIKSYTPLIEKETRLYDSKFYQKLFIVLILVSTFLIFPESPRELENICTNFNSRKLCNVW